MLGLKIKKIKPEGKCILHSWLLTNRDSWNIRILKIYLFIFEYDLLEDYWKQRQIEDIMGIYACTKKSIVLLARLL